jgi:PAS domain S-box-containing protein
MNFHELKKNEIASTPEKLSGKTVTAFINSALVVLSGNWYWDLYSDAVFCSDVILSIPVAFAGTKGLIHPDDLQDLKAYLSGNRTKNTDLQFRIITTYGEVKTLVGQNISIAENIESDSVIQTDILQQAAAVKDYEHLQLLNEVYSKAEKDTQTGTWFYNSSANKAWYSNAVFRLHDLVPQSLNAHLHTFYAFIHPDDKEVVTEFMDKAYRQRSPLHLEYRIVTPAKEKLVLYTSQWFYTAKGEAVLTGTLRDVSEQKLAEQKLENAQDEAAFYKQLLHMDEQNASIGHWHVNLITRKFLYSDNFYRLFGLRPGAIPAGINALINYVHPDDRELYSIASRRMMIEHKVPELDFRIIRTDGKMRYISQKARLLTYGGEMIVAAFVQDVTVQKMLEKKLTEFTGEMSVKTFIQQQSEELWGTANWIVDLDNGKIKWSVGLYKLLGLKPGAVELTEKQLLLFIHPDDQKKFSDERAMAQQQRKDSEFEFRLLYRGNLKTIKVFLRIFTNQNGDFLVGMMQDKAREKSLEEQLYQAEELTGSLTDNIPNRVMITDINNTITFWNRQCEEAYKLKRDAVAGRNFFDVFPHLKTEEKLRMFNQVLKGESVNLKNFLSASGNGYFSLHMAPLWNKEKTEVTGIVHIAHDVTKEVELRKTTNERLHFIESLVESSVDKIIVLDHNMNYLIWNKRCEEYYHLRKEEVIGKNILEVFPDTIDDLDYLKFKRALRGETIYTPPAQDAGENYHEMYLIPVKNDKGEVIAVLWNLHDVTREYALTKEHQKTHIILDNINEGCLEIDGDERIIYLNSKVASFGSVDKEEVLNKKLTEAFPGLIDSAPYLAIQQAMQERSFLQHEFLWPAGDRWLFITLMPAGSGVIILLRDLQEIKDAREKLEEREALVQAAEAIAFAGSYEADLPAMKFRLSDGLFRIFGEDPQSFEPTPDFFHSRTYADDLPVVKQIFEKAVVDKQPYNYTCRIYRSDGELRTIEVHGHLICDASGKAVKDRGLVLDITHRIKAEQDLSGRKNLLQSVFDTSPTSVTVYKPIRDKDRNIEDFEIVVANPFAIKTVGNIDLVGSRLTALFPTSLKNGLFDKYVHVMKTGEPLDFEIWYEGEGLHHWFRMILHRMDQLLFVTADNITERKKAEADVHKNSVILKHAEELAQIGSWEYEIATGRFNWSEGMYRLFDLPQGVKVTPEIYLDFSLEEDRCTAQNIVDRFKKNHSAFEETIHIKKNSGACLLKVKGSVVENEKGEPEKLIGVDLDITEMQEVEDKMKESEDLLRQTARATPDAINIFDLEKKQSIHLNNCLAEWIGVTNDEITRMGYQGRLELVHPDDREKLKKFNSGMSLAPAGETRTIEYRLLTKNSKILWIRDRTKVFKTNKEGKPTHLLSVLQEFTEEVELRNQLLERTQYAETIIDTSIDRIMMYDRNFNIIAWNKRSEDVTGVRKDQAIGKNVLELFPKVKSDEELMKAFTSSMTGEYVHLPPKKSTYTGTFYERFYIPLKDETGETYAVLNIMHDISDMVHQREELKELNKTLEKKNKELEEKNEEISSFAFIASHDLKEPLRKLYTFSDWLLQKEGESLSDTGRQYIKKIANSVRRMDMLIEDVLVLAKIGSDRGMEMMIDLNAVLERVIGDMKEYIKQQGAEIIVDELPVIMGNSNQVFYLFKNLISNAIKFQAPGNQPVLTIKTEKIEGGLVDNNRSAEAQDYYKISFEDNGLGFEERYTKKIFQVFQRLHASKEFEGTGMGLAICRKIMENHNGFITATSEPGKGSVFCCYFPIL